MKKSNMRLLGGICLEFARTGLSVTKEFSDTGFSEMGRSNRYKGKRQEIETRVGLRELRKRQFK